MAVGTLVITRPGHWSDRLRRYRLVVDGRRVGRIAAGERLELTLPAGEHRLVARIDWARSNELEVGVRAGQPTEVEVGTNVCGWLLLASLYFATFGFRQWLYVRHRVVGFPVLPAAVDIGDELGRPVS